MSFIQAIKNLLKRVLPPPVRAFNREVARILGAVEAERQENHEKFAELSAQVQAQQEALERMLAELAAMRAAGDLQFAALEAAGAAALGEACTRFDGIAAMLEAGQRQARESAGIHTKSLLALGEQLGGIAEQGERLESLVQGGCEQAGCTLTKLLENQKSGNVQIQKDIRKVERIIPNKPVYWSNEFERRVVQENWGNVTEQPDFEQKYLRLVSGMDSESVAAVTRILSRQKKYLHSEEKFLDLFTREEQEELRQLKEHFDREIFKVSDSLYAYRNYLLPVNHFESSVFYFRHGLEQLKTLERVKGKAIVDVGGFVGDSVLILSELSPSKIYTFEAVPENFALLKETVELNHVPNVVAENVALGAEPGSMTMHLAGSGSTAIVRPGLSYKGDIEVPVITLDDYVTEHKLNIGLIKVDIEGAEPSFLVGAKKTICEQRPILLLSIYHNAHDFFELKPLIESWELGYRFSIHKPTFGNTTSEALLFAEMPLK